MIKYIKKSLFSAPKGSIILHATNAKGVWGNGIAKEFAKRYPSAHKVYERFCKSTHENEIAGKCLLIPTMNFQIGCLFTSKKYGMFKDKPDVIVRNTQLALCDLINQMNRKPDHVVTDMEFHLPKINSGLFGVAWKKTEEAIKEVDAVAKKQGYSITWNVYEI